LIPRLYNRLVTRDPTARWIKRFAGFAPERSLPPVATTTLASRHARNANPSSLAYPHGRVHLFCDEFTDFTDADVGIKAVQLLNRLGYEVTIPRHVESGRAHFSKGLVRDAQRLAVRNVSLLRDLITSEAPLVGIEPSAILSFRDEYLDLVPDTLLDDARRLAANALLIDEFIAREADAG